MKNKVGIIGAMASEVKDLVSSLSDYKKEKHYNLTFHTGKLEGVDVVVLQCGVGKVNAARSTQMLIDFYNPTLIINTGIAGGTAPNVAPFDAIIATKLVQHDFDVTPFGHAKGYMCTGKESNKPTLFTPSEEYSALFEKACDEFFDPTQVKRGVIATGDIFVASPHLRSSIYNEFGALAAEMEGGAIAQVAEYDAVPFVVLRVISDNADGEATVSFDTLEKESARRSALTVKAFLSLLP